MLQLIARRTFLLTWHHQVKAAAFLVLFLFAALIFCGPGCSGSSDHHTGESSAGGDEPPTNPFLADSPWPMSHRNPYCQASSPFPGPTQALDIEEPDFIQGTIGLITPTFSGLYPDGSRVIWGSSIPQIYKVSPYQDGPYYDSQTKQDFNLLQLDAYISGAYTILDHEGTFFVPRLEKIYAYGDAVAGDPLSKIEVKGVYEIPASEMQGEGDIIVGFNITHDGWLALATRHGTVGVVSRSFESAAFQQLGADEEISNSIACDENGGIYVVTSRQMHRLQWTGSELSLSEADGAWSAGYETGDRAGGMRLGPGSGSTPSLMGTGGQDKFVVITDGQELMHLVLFWREDIPEDWTRIPGTRERRIAAQVPVCFGDPQAVQSLSEQSVCVRGYGALVVNNQLEFSTNIPFVDVWFSGVPAIAPYGVEKFVWDPETRTLASAWVNQEVSMPNGIPSMSAATNLIYNIGQRGGVWTIEALDWDTGEVAFFQELGANMKYNSVYAATEVGPDSGLYAGTGMGLIRLIP